MLGFIAKHQDEIRGVLSGFDRVIFRGTLRFLSHVVGLETYLSMNKVLLKDFGRHVEQVKIFSGDESARERYSPSQFVEAIPSVVTGNPDVRFIRTSHAERNNLTIRIADAPSHTSDERFLEEVGKPGRRIRASLRVP